MGTSQEDEQEPPVRLCSLGSKILKDSLQMKFPSQSFCVPLGIFGILEILTKNSSYAKKQCPDSVNSLLIRSYSKEGLGHQNRSVLAPSPNMGSFLPNGHHPYILSSWK